MGGGVKRLVEWRYYYSEQTQRGIMFPGRPAGFMEAVGNVSGRSPYHEVALLQRPRANGRRCHYRIGLPESHGGVESEAVEPG